MTMRRPSLGVVSASLVLVAATAFVACSSGGRNRPRGPGAPAGMDAQASPGMVTLTDDDLAPVDAFIRHRRWILGDGVDVTASKEYFSQYLTVVSRVGSVRQDEALEPGGEAVTLTYLGAPGTADVTTAPRAMIGTGITVTARGQLRLHFTKTTDANTPVRLSITAHGKASTGVENTVERRADDISIGGTLRKDGAGYRWDEIAR